MIIIKQTHKVSDLKKLVVMIIFICFIFFSCNNSLQSPKESDVRYNNLCNKEYELDAESMEIGDVKNLKIFNGVKFLKFGTNKLNYKECIECYSKEDLKVDTCELTKQLKFLGLMWKCRIFFINDTLSRIELDKINNNSFYDVYKKLSTILGEPNVKDLYVNKGKWHEEIYNVYGSDIRQFEPYYQDINKYISEFKKKEKSDVENKNENIIIEDILRLSDVLHQIDEENKKYAYNGGSKNVKIQFYDSLNFESIWLSTVVLKLDNTVYSTLRLDTQKANSSKSFGDKKDKDFGYNINQEELIKVNFYINEANILFFENLEKENLLKIIKANKEKDIDKKLEEKRKILEEF